MTFSVIVHAFGTPQLRRVTIPGKPGQYNINEILDLIFRYGQNEFQERDCPSVSVGDFILLTNDEYRVAEVGFTKLLERVN